MVSSLLDALVNISLRMENGVTAYFLKEYLSKYILQNTAKMHSFDHCHERLDKYELILNDRRDKVENSKWN